MREAASRGFWVASSVPYGYLKIMARDVGRMRPKLEPDEDITPVVKRIFDMAEAGQATLDIARTLNNDGIVSPRGKSWGTTTIHGILNNEVYTGTLVWGASTEDKADPVRVEKAFPSIVSEDQFHRVRKIKRSRSPKTIHPRRLRSSFLLSGLVKCKTLQRGAHRPVRQERQVRLLRLPVAR